MPILQTLIRGIRVIRGLISVLCVILYSAADDITETSGDSLLGVWVDEVVESGQRAIFL